MLFDDTKAKALNHFLNALGALTSEGDQKTKPRPNIRSGGERKKPCCTAPALSNMQRKRGYR